MAKRNSSGAGGGINSNKRVDQPVRFGERARAISPAGVAQIGMSVGNHITGKRKSVDGGAEPVRGALKPAGGPGGVPLGNSVALNVGKGGPGTGRTIMKSGSQCQTGPANPGLGRIANTKGQWPD